MLKKFIFVAIVIGVMVCVIYGSLNDMQKSTYEVNNTNKTTISIIADSITNRSLSIEILNTEKRSVNVGMWYTVEKYKYGNWYVLPYIANSAEILSIAYELPTGETMEMHYDWMYEYGELPRGKYRIVTSINIESKDGKYKKYYLAAPFTIE